MKIAHLADGSYFQWKLGGSPEIHIVVDRQEGLYRTVGQMRGLQAYLLATTMPVVRDQKGRDIRRLQETYIGQLLDAKRAVDQALAEATEIVGRGPTPQEVALPRIPWRPMPRSRS